MVEQKFELVGFKMFLGLKDINLVFVVVEQVFVNLFFVELVKGYFESGIEKGFGDLDWVVFIKCIK